MTGLLFQLMKTEKTKFRKKPYREPCDTTSSSRLLREIGNHISRKRYSEALALANAQLDRLQLSPAEQSRILSLIGDSEYKRGMFATAAEIYLRAATMAQGSHDLWLRPLIGHVRALLKDVRPDDAALVARNAVDIAKLKSEEFEARVGAANRNVFMGRAQAVPAVPPRVSVVATRMGYLFLHEGEMALAEEMFSTAIEINPKGASRAKQGLARIALAEGRFEMAMRMATDSIRAGQFGAKTLSAWPILIAARRRLGLQEVGQALLNEMQKAPSSVRARAIISIVQELRRHNLDQWQELAEVWVRQEGNKYPSVKAEVRKLQLASVVAGEGGASIRRLAAERVREVSGLSPSEWLSATKEWVRAAIWDGRTVNLNNLIGEGVRLYGGDFKVTVAHGLALSCMMAKRHDLARGLLERNIACNKTEDPVWGKSLWALARMEAMLNRHSVAANLYYQFQGVANIPLRFRLQARLLWAESLLASGEAADLLRMREELTEVLNSVDDPDLLMNFARQLQFGPEELHEWGKTLFDRGSALAMVQFEQADHPSVALNAIFKLARRQVYDFGRSAEAVRFWSELDEETREWLWSTRSRFWEYMGLLVEARARLGDISALEYFARFWLDDPSTPAEGRVLVGVPYARHLISCGRSKEALLLFKDLVDAAPSHVRCAEAYYWLGLDAYRAGNIAEAKQIATCIRRAQGVRVGLLSEWDLDAKALLLLADLQVDRVYGQAVDHNRDRLTETRDEIFKDMSLL